MPIAIAVMDTGFLKTRANLFEGLFSIYELLLIVVCFLVVHRITEGDLDLLLESMFVVQVTVITTYLVFKSGGVYKSARGRSLVSEMGRLFVCFGLVVLIVGLFAFLTKFGEVVSRLWFGCSVVLAFVFIVSGRVALRIGLRQLRKSGFNWRTVAIVGSGDLAANSVHQLENNPWVGMKVSGIFSDGDIPDGSVLQKYPRVGTVSELAEFVETRRAQSNPVDQVWIALPLSDVARTRQIVSDLENSSVDVCVVPDLFGISLLRGSIDEIGGVPLINMSAVGIHGIGEITKRIIDVVLSSVALVLLIPVFLAIAVAIKLDSRGPVLFAQRRYGVNGKEIKVLKFRTMSTQDDGATVKQAVPGDARITRLGSLLRSYSLDELPQLYNVLVGSMSLVGPRPHAVSHNEEYRVKISGYMMRHKIKPGITGWAQVNGWRGETETLQKMEKRVEFDLEYMKNWSVWFDIKILLLTLVRGFSNKNAY